MNEVEKSEMVEATKDLGVGWYDATNFVRWESSRRELAQWAVDMKEKIGNKSIRELIQ